jgi:hypothetical protein
MAGVPRELARRWIGPCLKADPAYGEERARTLGLNFSQAAE